MTTNNKIFDGETLLRLERNDGSWSLCSTEIPLEDGSGGRHIFLVLIDNTRIVSELHFSSRNGKLKCFTSLPTRELGQITLKPYISCLPQPAFLLWINACKIGLEINDLKKPFISGIVNCRAGTDSVLRHLGLIFDSKAAPPSRTSDTNQAVKLILREISSVDLTQNKQQPLQLLLDEYAFLHEKLDNSKSVGRFRRRIQSS